MKEYAPDLNKAIVNKNLEIMDEGLTRVIKETKWINVPDEDVMEINGLTYPTTEVVGYIDKRMGMIKALGNMENVPSSITNVYLKFTFSVVLSPIGLEIMSLNTHGNLSEQANKNVREAMKKFNTKTRPPNT